MSIGDGGEGTVRALVEGTNGRIVKLDVEGPLSMRIESFYGISGDGKTAFIEMAAASGLEGLERELRNPLLTTTYGTGELILDAINQNVERIIIGLGGSATNDGGAGMARALGVKFLNKNGRELDGSGGSLEFLDRICMENLDERIKEVEFIVASDVDNPLVGTKGASNTFARQKGANEIMVEKLENNLIHYAHVIESTLNKDISTRPGSGAAGGLGAGLLAFTDATFRSGIDIVLELLQFDEKLDGIDLVITGEGKLDSQTIHGKAPIGVARKAKARNIPVIAFCGITGDGFETVYDHGINAVYPIVSKLVPLEESLKKGKENLYQTAYSVAKTLILKENNNERI
jgi:glycerate kinase